jgi:hypothetical protein
MMKKPYQILPLFLMGFVFIVGCTKASSKNGSERVQTNTPVEVESPSPESSPTHIPTEAPRDRDLIRNVSLDVTNDYPNGLTFEINAESVNPVEKVTFYYRLRSTESLTMESVEFQQAEQITASFFWDTSRFTVAPSSTIFYHWEFEDEGGNIAFSNEEQVNYDDVRFPWNELSDSDLIVRWYEGNREFGERIYEAARQSLDRMKLETDSVLEFPLFVLLYANETDFESWHFYVEDWVGGQAFTSLGVTTQIIGSDASNFWINDVIPHEIAHLFFYQLVESNLSSWPSWLDEGFAQYYEISNKTPVLERVRTAAHNGQLTPLRYLSGSFGHDLEEVRLAYDQSLSTVLFIHETWGVEGLQSLIDTIRNGLTISPALEEAYNLTFEEFEAEWRTWLGVPTTPEPSPTLFPTFEVIGGPTQPPVDPTGTPTQ